MKRCPRPARAPLATALLAGLVGLSGLVGTGAPRAAAAATPSLRTQISVDGPVDIDELLQVARIRAAAMTSTFYKYTFRQSVTEEQLAEDGAVKRSETRVYHVVPSPDGTERHLISRDGRPPSAAEARKQEKRNAALKKRWERIRQRQKDVAAKKAAERAKSASDGQRSGAAAAAPGTPARTDKPASVVKPSAPEPVASSAPAPPREQAGPTEQAAPMTAEPSTSAQAMEPQPAAPIAPALPPLPPCDVDDPESSLRPPLPGSITRTRRTPVVAAAEARKARESPSDYSLWELLQLTDYEYAGACQIDSRPVHVLTFDPPESFDVTNPVERVMTAMSGTLVLDGRDLQVSRAEGLSVAPITWGGGLVKLRSARVLLEYAKVQGEIWLPSRDVFEFDTRVLLDSDRQRVTHVFDDFKKAIVEVETEYEYLETPTQP